MLEPNDKTLIPSFISMKILANYDYEIEDVNTISISYANSENINDYMTLNIKLDGINFKRGISIKYSIPDNQSYIDFNPSIISEFELTSCVSIPLMDLTMTPFFNITFGYDNEVVETQFTINVK